MKRLISLLLISTMLIFASVGFGAETKEPVITLKFCDYYTPGHILDPSVNEFIKRIELFSNDRIKIQRYPAGQLGKAQDFLDIVSSGTADIATLVIGYFGGQLPISTVMMLPKYTTAVEGSAVQRRLFHESPEIQEEFGKYGIKPVMQFQVNQTDIQTTKKPVRSPQDLKGLKIGTPGGFVDNIMKAYGIVPVTLTASDLYEAVQKGIVDGTVLSLPTIKNLRLDDFTKYATIGLRMGGSHASWCVNVKRYKSLPEDLQKIIDQAGEEVSKASALRWDQYGWALKDGYEKKGMSFYIVKPEERAAWYAPLAQVDPLWMKDMKDRGVPDEKVKKVYDLYVKICKEL